MGQIAARKQVLTTGFVAFAPGRQVVSGIFYCPTGNAGIVYAEGLDSADAAAAVPVIGPFVVHDVDLSAVKFKSSVADDVIVFLGGD